MIWPGTMILLISASQVARITSMSHQHLASFKFENILTRGIFV
jgi:hypothetical protein